VPLGESKDGHQGFFTIGARVGGLFGPALGEWSLPQGADASGGPSATLAGLYATLAVGFGGRPEPMP
jgi:hypothetical protein